MHASFADWYRPLLTQPDDKFLKSRWGLVEATATNLSIPLALELLRLSFGLPNQDDESIAGLKKQLKSEGISYIRATASLELALIGDCALLQSFEQADHELLWSHVLLACALTSQQALRPTLQRPVQAELFQKARALVDRLAVQWRRNASSTVSDIKPGKKISVPNLEEVTTVREKYHLRGNYINEMIEFDIPDIKKINKMVELSNNTKKSVEELAEQTTALSNSLNGLLQAFRTAMTAPQEENNIHWYLLGETSRDLQRRFSSLTVAELTLVAAKELADLTENVPGLYAALAFLDRVLGQERRADTATPISINQAVAAVQPLWRAKGIHVTGFDATQDLTPVLCALSYATTGDVDWRAMTPQLCKVDMDTKLPPLLLSYQLYQEILLSRLAQQRLGQKGAK